MMGAPLQQVWKAAMVLLLTPAAQAAFGDIRALTEARLQFCRTSSGRVDCVGARMEKVFVGVTAALPAEVAIEIVDIVRWTMGLCELSFERMAEGIRGVFGFFERAKEKRRSSGSY